MSKTRHSEDIAIRTMGLTLLAPRVVALPAHGWDQLIYATRGVVTVHTDHGAWVLPAQRGLWVPGGVAHRIEVPGPASLRSLYLRARLSRKLPRKYCSVTVSPLLRELILYAVREGALDRNIPEHRRLIGVILDQLTLLPASPFELPSPSDPRAVRAADLLRSDPAARTSLRKIAKRAGASLRTLERLFRSETGLPLASWRRRMRLLHALRLLAAREPVTSVALETGYDSTSAFIAMFRKEMGTTPSRYFAISSLS